MASREEFPDPLGLLMRSSRSEPKRKPVTTHTVDMRQTRDMVDALARFGFVPEDERINFAPRYFVALPTDVADRLVLTRELDRTIDFTLNACRLTQNGDTGRREIANFLGHTLESKLQHAVPLRKRRGNNRVAIGIFSRDSFNRPVKQIGETVQAVVYVTHLF